MSDSQKGVLTDFLNFIFIVTFENNSESSGDFSIYVNWDGRDDAGAQLTSGIYYYQAKVTFDTVDPDQKEKTFKGWVHLVR